MTKKHEHGKKNKEFLKELERYKLIEQLFYENYSGLIFSTIRDTLKDRGVVYTNEDVEDFYSDILFQFLKNNWHKLREYDKKKGLRFPGWIRLLTIRMTLEKLRKKGTLDIGRRKFVGSIDEEILQDEHDVGRDYENKELLMKAMDDLPLEDRMILKLRHIYGMSPEEIADLIGKKYNATSAAMSRAKKKLKGLIEKKMDNEALPE